MTLRLDNAKTLPDFITGNDSAMLSERVTAMPDIDILDLSTDEKLLGHFKSICPHVPDQTNVVGVPVAPGRCKKCDFRDRDQMYGGTTPFGPLFLSKAKAENIVNNHKTPHEIPERLLNFLIYQNEWEEEHARHVADVRTPGIVACGGLKVAGNTHLFCYLLDGTHRAVAAKRAGRPYEAFVLSFKETVDCLWRDPLKIES